jgi:5-enolpyruvylshikimate-3-phosphate synthase
VLLTAVLAEGVTELSNAAVEPEIEDLICVLQKMGAIISVDVDRVITIAGVGAARLRPFRDARPAGSGFLGWCRYRDQRSYLCTRCAAGR